MHLSEERLAKKIKKLTWNQEADVAADTERRLKTLNSIHNRGYYTDKNQREEFLDNRQFGNSVAMRIYGGKGIKPRIPDVSLIKIPLLLPEYSKYQQVVDYAVKKKQMNYQGQKYLIVDMVIGAFSIVGKELYDSIQYNGYAQDIVIDNKYIVSEVDEQKIKFHYIQ